ncbi:MAG: adenosylcobalamin-dependent ribonucleoside-diphosphate reductase [Chloroflexi bacterium]|nr:adenosylcobalamin-dependent ribonucleoside-diphosphate reductase [Chloroflexota bacterium]
MVTTPQLTENALTVLKSRYLMNGETPKDLFWRVANAVAAPEADPETWAAQFYEMMADTRFLPNSPTLFNAGTGAGTLSACFVIPVEDTMESIMEAATTSAMIQKYGGGIGYSFSQLRSRGSHITTTHGKACGAVAVLKLMSALSDMITQGGKRHGANMGILSISHPEIYDFIHMKDDYVTAQNFNISIAVTDEFMQAVEQDAQWDLVDPSLHEVMQTVSARELWNEIIDSAWKTGDPGLYFIDEANRNNPTPHLGRLESTNPCGEVPLLAHEACNLGSIDLGKFIIKDDVGTRFDFRSLEQLTRICARFLDNVVTINEFPTTEVADAVATTRKTGLGVMGWHDALIQLGIPYADPAAVDLANEVMGLINQTAKEVSIELAVERGPYPGCVGDPIRNATRTCIAPTGSISAIAGASSGIEPVFALAFVKNVLDGKQLREVNPHLEQVARDRGFWSDDLMDQVSQTGSIQHIDGIPDDVKRVFATAMEIPYEAHIAMQAAFQANTDLAVSKTINMRSDAARDDVEKAYLLSYNAKCTGITIYRDGSKPTQVLEVPGSRKLEQEEAAVYTGVRVPRERPRMIRGITERMRTAQGNAYVTINFDEDGTPFEVFTTIGKAGSTDQANLEAISRLISLALRSGIPAVEVVEQLRGITSEPVWDQGRLIKSSPDAVAQVLAIHALGGSEQELRLKDTYAAQSSLFVSAEELMTRSKDGGPSGPIDTVSNLQVVGITANQSKCPDCNGPVLMQEGCMSCPSCGWNKCG